MSTADSSLTRLAYVMEDQPGVIPDTPAWKALNYVSETLDVQKQTDTPEEINGTRDVTDIVDLGRSVTGGVNTLLRYAAYDDLFSALFCAEWAGNVLKNGRLVKSMAFEKTFDFGGSSGYARYYGCRMNTLDLQLNSRTFAQANWGVMGLGAPDPDDDIITDATYAAASTAPVLNTGLNIGSLVVGGVTVPPKIQQANLNITNNIYANDVLGKYEPDSHGLGTFTVTGSLTALFDSIELYQKVLQHADLSLSLKIGAAANSNYVFSLGKIKASGGPQVGGNNRAVVMQMNISAKIDPAISGTMSLTRAVA
ncbi:phage tail tube protein [Rhizobium sp. SG570]|uniref:phage tail tube protein n=1 Tax=Rhizobium sp. SG570 TaxID=2587113 RepID=UPI0014482283|nr:phage tail tube protein [Rhizobium sp. SG570]NKJ34110.1 hypothetical protein [Rhizobium sp. SG570]